MAAQRGAFVDQSQSFNAFMETPNKAKVTSMHFYRYFHQKIFNFYFFYFLMKIIFSILQHFFFRFYFSNLIISWKAGLKTGMYYLRTRPAVNAIQFTVDKEKIEKETVSVWNHFIKDYSKSN